MAKIDYFLWTPHYLDHALPVWKEIPPEHRGTIVIPTNLFSKSEFSPRDFIEDCHWVKDFQEGINWLNQGRGLVVILTVNNSTVALLKRPLVFQDHGLGQFYKVPYEHVPELPQLVGTLAPNEFFENWCDQKFPQVEQKIVGSPSTDVKLSNLSDRTTRVKNQEKPTVAISFHFDRKLCPETRTTFPYYKGAVARLVDQDEFKLVGHAHPRIRSCLIPWYEEHGIPFIKEFSNVTGIADLYVMDNSSTLFEFAALGKPVVVLNAPFFRRDVHHGLRFWEVADVGIQCDQPEELLPSILKALKDPPKVKQRREKALKKVFPFQDGKSAHRAVDFLLELDKKTDFERYQGISNDYPGFDELFLRWKKEEKPKSIAMIGAGGLTRGFFEASPHLLESCDLIIDPFDQQEAPSEIKRIPVQTSKNFKDIRFDSFILGVSEVDQDLQDILKPVENSVINFFHLYSNYKENILLETYY